MKRKKDLSLEMGSMDELLSQLKSRKKHTKKHDHKKCDHKKDDHKKHDHKKHHNCKKNGNGNGVVCDGCACTFLANAEEGDLFNLLLEGNDNFLNLAGNGGNRTDFEFQGFEDCCAIFTFESTGQTEETFVVDCRCICALVPVEDNGNGGGGTPPVTPPTTPVIPVIPGSLRARLLELLGELVQIEVGNELFNPLVGRVLAVRTDYIVLLETTGNQTLVRLDQIETVTEL
ncbi:hypothetical protein [uncultured Metabacillus sp.]|uniref:hypothetical protein n=1 Tax=uncultured Metabacillus sp. TaxID=2860135 RepID=UPI002612F59C|nr:hypothetical protein [uncultured Metabacillus sp.]